VSESSINTLIPLWVIIIPIIAGLAIIFIGAISNGLVSQYGKSAMTENNQKSARLLPAVVPLRNLFLLGGTILPLVLILKLYPLVRGGGIVLCSLAVFPPLGLNFRLDMLSIFMGLLFGFMGVIIAVYSIDYMRDDPLPGRFFGFLMFVFAGCMGVVLAGDLFSLFLFFEFMSIMFFILVAHHATPEAVAAGMKFLFMTIIAGVSLFMAVAIIYMECGSLTFGSAGLVTGYSFLSLLAFIGFMIAFGTKAAMFPLHFWQPDAYTYAPLPAALLSSTLMLKTGVYGLARVFYNIFGVDFWGTVSWDSVIIVLAAFTILFGSTIAIAQDDLIRRLAYSGIAQLGYIILGIAILTPDALIGATFHIMTHAFMKGCLFLCAGSIISQTGIRSIKQMKGIGYKLPVTMLAFAVAGLTAVGVPPLNLFIVKWHLSLGALEIGQPILIIVLLISSLLNAAYYLPIAYHAFLGREESTTMPREFSVKNFREPRAAMLVPSVTLAVGCLVFGLFIHNWPLEMVRSVIATLY
jgi:multicomponent Na+:H+ antiporter subunit D